MLVHETCLDPTPTRPSSQCLGGQRTSVPRTGRLRADHSLPNRAWELLGDTPAGTGPNWATVGSLQQLDSRDDPSF